MLHAENVLIISVHIYPQKSMLESDLSTSKSSNKEGSPKKSAQEKRPKVKKQTKEHLETEMKNMKNTGTTVKSALKKQMKHPQTEAKKRENAGTAIKSKSKKAQKVWHEECFRL